MTDRDNIIVWFSCGATSAVAAMLALKKYKGKNVRIIYTDTGSDHEDNFRFMKDCEDFYDQEIEIHKNEKYENTLDVYRKTRYLVGVRGARCTSELKKMVRLKIQEAEGWGDFECIQVFGFDLAEDRDRVPKFRQNNPEINLDTILIEHNLTKPNCLSILEKAGIKPPITYELGFANANCLKTGCVKGQAGYWNHMRKVFGGMEDSESPFFKMAVIERQLNVAICKTEPIDPKTGKKQRIRIFLDELKPDQGRYDEVVPACGIACGIAIDELDIEPVDCTGATDESLEKIFEWLT